MYVFKIGGYFFGQLTWPEQKSLFSLMSTDDNYPTYVYDRQKKERNIFAGWRNEF